MTVVNWGARDALRDVFFRQRRARPWGAPPLAGHRRLTSLMTQLYPAGGLHDSSRVQGVVRRLLFRARRVPDAGSMGADPGQG